jgi:hypothetical protein
MIKEMPIIRNWMFSYPTPYISELRDRKQKVLDVNHTKSPAMEDVMPIYF